MGGATIRAQVTALKEEQEPAFTQSQKDAHEATTARLNARLGDSESEEWHEKYAEDSAQNATSNKENASLRTRLAAASPPSDYNYVKYRLSRQV